MTSTPAAPRPACQPAVPVSSRKAVAKRARTSTHSQPRFKLHVTHSNTQKHNLQGTVAAEDNDEIVDLAPTSPQTTSERPSPRNKPRHSKGGPPSPPQVLALHQPHPPDAPSLSSLTQVCMTSTILACASKTQLTTWYLSSSYSPSSRTTTASPYAHILSTYIAPPDHVISSLAVAPDSSCIALVISSIESAFAPTAALLLLRPRTAERLLRLALPANLSFPRLSQTTSLPNKNLSLAFVSASHPCSDNDTQGLPRDADLSPHLRYTFQQYARIPKLPAEPASSSPDRDNKPPVARHALAVCGDNGVAALYNFSPSCKRLVQYSTLDPPEFLLSDASVRMSSVHVLYHCAQRQQRTRGCQSDNGLLTFTCDTGAVAFRGNAPAVQVSAEDFRLLVPCAARQGREGSLALLLLVSTTLSQRYSKEDVKQRSGRDLERNFPGSRRLAWAFKTSTDKWQFVFVHGLREEDLADVCVYNRSNDSLTALLFTISGAVRRYVISVRGNPPFRIVCCDLNEPLRSVLETGIGNRRKMILPRNDHFLMASLVESHVLVTAAYEELGSDSLQIGR